MDLCPPLLVGVLSSGGEEEEGEESSRSQGKEVFLTVKQSLLVEVEVQQGMELRRLDLDSLSHVEVTQNSWRREVRRRTRRRVEVTQNSWKREVMRSRGGVEGHTELCEEEEERGDERSYRTPERGR